MLIDYSFKEYKKIKGIIEVKTGLHIGGSSDTIEIGGNDNPIIRHPLSQEPYIPGSSLKGKMRALLEWKLGKIEKNGEPHKWCEDNKCPICRIFGTSADEANLGPSRLIVRDAELDPKYKKEEMEDKKITIFDIVENKWENKINRINAGATPRPVERVISGVRFAFEIAYRIFNFGGDNGEVDEKLFEHVIDGLSLIQKDALGGSSSRGCGKIEFKDLENEKGESIKLE